MKKVKIMIVDDEPFARECLVEFVQGLKNCTVIGNYANGYDAFQSIEREKPDIIITDIKMPAMNGITLIEELHIKYPDIKSILISGYKDFEYAKAALDNNVVGYVLKPLDLNELILVINRAIQRINDEQNKEKIRTERDFFEAVIKGNSFMENESSWEIYETQNSLYYCVLLIQIFEGMKPQGISQYNHFLLKQEQMVILEDISNNTLIILRSASPRQLEINATQTANAICGLLEADFSCRFCISSSRVEKSIDALPNLYREALNIANLRHLQGENRVYLGIESEAQLFSNANSQNLRPLLDTSEIIESILHRDTDYVDNLLESIIREFKNSHASFQEICSYTKDVMLKTTSVLTSDDSLQQKSTQYLCRLYTCGCMDGMYSLLREFAQECIENRKKAGLERYIFQAKEYIKLNFSNPALTVAKVAEHLHLTPSYFSTLFSTYTGMAAGRYISQQRIEFAKSLLLNSPDNIDTVSERSGYINCNYFYKVFKASTGLTPKEYRNTSTVTPQD